MNFNHLKFHFSRGNQTGRWLKTFNQINFSHKIKEYPNTPGYSISNYFPFRKTSHSNCQVCRRIVMPLMVMGSLITHGVHVPTQDEERGLCHSARCATDAWSTCANAAINSGRRDTRLL